MIDGMLTVRLHIHYYRRVMYVVAVDHVDYNRIFTCNNTLTINFRVMSQVNREIINSAIIGY